MLYKLNWECIGRHGNCIRLIGQNFTNKSTLSEKFSVDWNVGDMPYAYSKK